MFCGISHLKKKNGTTFTVSIKHAIHKSSDMWQDTVQYVFIPKPQLHETFFFFSNFPLSLAVGIVVFFSWTHKFKYWVYSNQPESQYFWPFIQHYTAPQMWLHGKYTHFFAQMTTCAKKREAAWARVLKHSLRPDLAAVMSARSKTGEIPARNIQTCDKAQPMQLNSTGVLLNPKMAKFMLAFLF